MPRIPPASYHNAHTGRAGGHVHFQGRNAPAPKRMGNETSRAVRATPVRSVYRTPRNMVMRGQKIDIYA